MTRECPRVATVILNHNQYELTRDALTSLKKCRWDDHDIIVVDNDSRDGSVDKLRREIPGIEFVEPGSNLGCAGGRNLGARIVLERGAEFVFFMDNDALIAEDCIALLVSHMERDPSLGLIGPAVMEHPRTDLISSMGTVIEWEKCRYYALQDAPREMPPDHLIDSAWVPGTAWMVRASLFAEVGFLDERYFIYFEDTDFSLRIQRKGYRTAVAPEAVIWHRQESSVGAGLPASGYYYTRNRLLFFSTYSPRPLFSRIYLLFHGLVWTVRLILNQKWAMAMAVLSGIKDASIGKWGDVF